MSASTTVTVRIRLTLAQTANMARWAEPGRAPGSSATTAARRPAPPSGTATSRTAGITRRRSAARPAAIAVPPSSRCSR